MKPFSESGIYDSVSDPFFITGSIGIGEIPNSFAGRLRDKEQIRLTFSVDNPVKMLPNTSSIYYYNHTSRQWNIPTRSVDDHVGPFQRYSFPTYDIDLIGGSGLTDNDLTRGSVVVEDAKGFDAYGRVVASGSLDIFRQVLPSNQNEYCQTIEVIGQNRSIESTIDYMTNDYSGSVQRAQIYDASNSETFTLNIDKPFLIEKAVIEIPFNLGSTWFQDKTATCYGFATGTWQGTDQIGTSGYAYVDKGGPAITVSMFCQKKYGSSSIRDLIMSGTITHDGDIRQGAKVRYLGNFGVPVYVIEAIGMNSSGSCVVARNNGNSFTGSAVVKMTAAISNGIGNSIQGVYGIKDVAVSGYYTPADFIVFATDVISSQQVSLDYFNQISNNVNSSVTSIDPFGRGMTGFSPSGGSIFGGEYVTPQQPSKFVNNPYYIETQYERSVMISDVTDALVHMLTTPGSSPKTIGAMIVGADFPNFSANKDSPYLVNPGEKLVLAISKTRPAVSASGHDIPDAASALIGRSRLVRHVPLTGSVTGHDVTLATGSINITLYGSYVRQGSRYTP